MPKKGELAKLGKVFNTVIRNVHAVAERANALLKVIFRALRRISFDPTAITRIDGTALVLRQIEQDSAITSHDAPWNPAAVAEPSR